jgi:hypothetical protein
LQIVRRRDNFAGIQLKEFRMVVVACKLPHGLMVRHNGKSVNLNGPNADQNPLVLMPNGVDMDSANVSAGFGLTELKGDDEATFTDWCKAVQFDKDGKTKLAEPFAPLTNGSLISFGSMDEARKETKNLAGMVETGVEGIDPKTDSQMKADGLETA